MFEQTIENIIKMRMAVYQAGVNAGCWTDIEGAGASAMMDYIFPKSGQIAYYNLLLEQMRKEHSMLTGGVFFLYKSLFRLRRKSLNTFAMAKLTC